MGWYGKSFSCEKRETIAERGNAMIYVLIIIALFAALSFVLARQTATDEANVVPKEKVLLAATQLIQQSYAMKTAIERMTFSGTNVNDIDFVLPGEAGYTVSPHVDKLFHPRGGGAILPKIPEYAIDEINTDPPAGIYLGRFNNLEWTPSATKEVLYTAHQITRDVCEEINYKLRGSRVIPALTGVLNQYLTFDGDTTGGDDGTGSHSGSNADLTIAVCPDPDGGGPEEGCEGYPALCVANGTMHSFYSILVVR